MSIIIMIVGISTLLIIGTYILNKREIDREKLSIYECGFQPFKDAKGGIYIKFFIVGLIFLIFDLETVLLYPLTINIKNLSIIGYIVFLIFVIILIYGLYLELKKGLL